MFDRFSKLAGRKAVLATAAVLALTTVAPTASFAGGRHWHGGGGAAFAGAAIAGAIGTGLAIAATRDAYAYDAPAYYGPGPVYYDEGPVYYHGPYTGPGSREYPGNGSVGRDPFASCSRSGAGCW
ncbi:MULTISPECIES: hypothetical protein [unclassified Bradyrhizobium]|uniref:hypothetical protein n=1 Tax=unclassified Bradyrhizobium TaxID=2631580 RepID=UPI0020B440D0|nr:MULTISPECIES: hypothetical protein [unclassified Bradyrhizobium]MCP3379795.1 hypothetical protein [Bradyrhizobium sp. CCGUVB4N]MCP3440545.1 hypothetical protein [Bradyrhizobium sp. CCGUVB14]WFU82388.1 hypothetical protein QA645_06490 [Bradyrhizobium sp. CIAT3101]